MIGFRFKITFENDDSFLREVVFDSNQTFQDFHNFITEDLKLDQTKPASFHLCNHKFIKQQEISLISPENKDNENSKTDEDEDRNQNEKDGVSQSYIMTENSLSDLIDDPHQKLLYIYDYEKAFTFFIELLKVFPVENQNNLPQVVKQSGGIPRELQPPKTTEDNNNEGDEHDNESPEEEKIFFDQIDNIRLDEEDGIEGDTFYGDDIDEDK